MSKESRETNAEMLLQIVIGVMLFLAGVIAGLVVMVAAA